MLPNTNIIHQFLNFGMKCPRQGTKCPGTNCFGTKYPSTKCMGSKCPTPLFTIQDA